ncbi:AAA family ATPase [Deinococcus aquaedulcis]|uniref:AAA family ATPase n=1 Tax=Deinococcus aquaedulcis TaxID=2840455 RepID=UPI001C83CA1C|nr:AAA family ATPase [Deinococcus aquaedulcis]
MTASTNEVDSTLLLRGLRRHFKWILACSVAVAAIMYLLADAKPRIYQAQASLLAANVSLGNTSVDTAIIKAPPLPEGAIGQALISSSVMEPLIKAILASATINPAEKTRLRDTLRMELRTRSSSTVTLNSQVDPYGNGIYTVSARARNAQVSRDLANLAASALLTWDRNRALTSVRRAQAGYKAQLTQIDDQLSRQSTGIDRQTLIARRATIVGNLSQVSMMEDSVAGVLSPLADAQVPLAPVSPRPLRDAILGGIGALLIATLLSLGVTALDRTVRNEEDLLALGIPTLATVPRMRQRELIMMGLVRAARQAGLYEAIGFLRVNLLSALPQVAHPVVMISSTGPGEGKSSITAALADGVATSGKRVLILDADLRRGTQREVWKKYDESDRWRPLTGTGGVRTAHEALLNPDNVEVLEVEPNVDMLPAGSGIQDSLGVINQADFDRALALWRVKYDLVLIDSAPLLALADGLIIGKHADAVLLVTEYGRTNMQGVKSAIRRAEWAGLNLIGLVINKANAREESNYGYGYTYQARDGVVASR